MECTLTEVACILREQQLFIRAEQLNLHAIRFHHPARKFRPVDEHIDFHKAIVAMAEIIFDLLGQRLAAHRQEPELAGVAQGDRGGRDWGGIFREILVVASQ